MSHEKEIKYFSTFTGIGGFELGIDFALQRPHRKSSQQDCEHPKGRHARNAGRRGTCVGFSEIDKYAAQIYANHYPSHYNYGDITKIDAATLPDFDLYVGGFPCQAFSVAGKRRGFEDTRGTLFFDVARILRAKTPRHFILENVKGLLSHDDGRTFKTIIATLVELGYSVEWQVLNSKDFGVPQNRERVFIVGHLGGQCEHQVFPLGGGHEASAQPGYVEPISGTLSTKNQSGQCNFDGSTTLIAGTINRGKFKETGDIALTLPASYYKGHDNHGARPMVADSLRIRRLTPTECERLQGFPDGWTEGVSDTQRYKCLGNAVTVNVVSAVASVLLHS